MPRLIASLNGMVVQDYVLKESRTTLGRRSTNDIVLSDMAVSGEHAAFTYEKKIGIVVVDMPSTGRKPMTITAQFEDAVGLYAGNQVAVLGMPVGKVTIELTARPDMPDPRLQTTRALPELSTRTLETRWFRLASGNGLMS